VDLFHDVGAYDCVEIGLHEVEDEVDVFVVFGFEDVEEGDDVGVAVELLQEDDFAVGALGVGGVLEGVEYFLQGHHLLGLLIDGLPDHAVGSLS
jgi:hypothetical protein